jgi:hypothetical protein
MGFVGVLVALMLWHAWNDHVAFHRLAEYINIQAPKINKLPD